MIAADPDDVATAYVTDKDTQEPGKLPTSEPAKLEKSVKDAGKNSVKEAVVTDEKSGEKGTGQTTAKPKVDPTPDAKDKSGILGNPLAPGILKLLQQEIYAAFVKRGDQDDWARWVRYANGRLDATAGKYTGSELTGNCRLTWYDYLLRHPVEAPIEAERFTRELHRGMLGDAEGLSYVLAIGSKKMDCGERKPRKLDSADTPEEALDRVKRSLVEAQESYAAAIAPLTKSQIRELTSYITPILLGNNNVGHTLVDRNTGRRLCDLMEMMDRKELFNAADALTAITDPELLEKLKSLPADGNVRVDGVAGPVVSKISTPAGTIIIGGKGQNTYQLDKIPDLCCVIDLGGDDVYIDGTVGPERPLLVTIDLAGNDIYRGTKTGVQGSAIVGVSMLVDLAGDDRYEAKDMAQGSAIAGVGILIDFAGNDRYLAFRRCQGHAIGGIGLLLDKSGKDDYHAAMWSQGFGGPLGFAVLDDLTGNDHYYTGGYYPDSYPETPGLEGWGQGVGAGIRQVADGGLGIILDGAGDDIYEFDYLSHGGGYWCGLGFARDFGGNDQRLITRKSYSGGQRTEPLFQRFACGWGCHYSLGFLFDDAGDDVYEGTIMGTGMAWDCSAGFLVDFAGNDRYKATGGLTQGTGRQMGLGVLFDYDGNDIYDGYGQGYASTNLTYHPVPTCGGNFSFVVDYGGEDQYGCGATNNTYIQRGGEGGFLIDRPRADEIQQTANKTSSQTDAVKTTKPRPGTSMMHKDMHREGLFGNNA